MIEIIPPSPDTLTPITLNISGFGVDTGSRLINNSPVFTAEVTKFIPGFPTPPQYKLSFPLGTLPAGSYTFQHREITEDGLGNITGNSIVASQAFTVSPAITPRSIPTLDASAFIILSFTLVLVATVFGRKYVMPR